MNRLLMTEEEEELQEKVQEIGVLQDKSHDLLGVLDKSGLARDAKGQILPGQRSLNPRGRKSRAVELEMLAAIKRAITPDQFEFYIQKALEIAIEQKSARSILKVLEFASSYGLGKPVQQVFKESGKSDLIAELMRDTTPLLPEPEPKVLDV